MHTEEKEFSPQQSLDLIRSMISHTRGAVVNNSFYFLLWGWLVFGCSVGQYLLKTYTAYPFHYMVWWLMPVGGLISAVYGSRQSKKTRVRSFVGDAISYLWIAIALAFIVLLLVNIMREKGWQVAFTYYILMYAIGTFVTGKLIEFKPLVIGGLINFVLAVVSVKFAYDEQLLIGAVAILVSYIIPGYLLRSKARRQNQTHG
ncbi:hypothetical protein [Sediminibacterium soli]|uniref:hypothetical protein n=1 Tax=Sediminibacterium soli TaxID=2698829 RepID=UPI001379D29F|nr:hypothetical protein [Sediminibacterium soli]NCI45484.1 hypothetical protein [Sediminibacterium soli]